MIRKVLYTVVVLLMVGGTAGWAKPAPIRHCVIFLEPIQPGETESKASQPVCSTGKIDSVNGNSLAASFLIVRFYDNNNYATLLVEYFGASACSPSVNYGVTSLPSGLDNRFNSGKSFSNCNTIHIWTHQNYSMGHYACGPNCPTFLSYNNTTSSWYVRY